MAIAWVIRQKIVEKTRSQPDKVIGILSLSKGCVLLTFKALVGYWEYYPPLLVCEFHQELAGSCLHEHRE